MSHTYQLPTQFCQVNGPLRWLPSRLVDHHLDQLLRPQQQRAAVAAAAAAMAAAATAAAAVAATSGNCGLLPQYRVLKQLQLSISRPKGTYITPVIVWQGLPIPPHSSSPRARVYNDTHESGSPQLSVRRCPLSGPTSRCFNGRFQPD